MNDTLDPETFCQQVPSVSDYVTAFRAIEPELTEHHLRMLRAHHRASEHALTATILAYEMGYTSYGTANLHYGRLARRVAEALGIRLTYWVNVLADFIPPEQGGNPHWLWVMWPQVTAALDEVGWANPA